MRTARHTVPTRPSLPQCWTLVSPPSISYLPSPAKLSPRPLRLCGKKSSSRLRRRTKRNRPVTAIATGRFNSGNDLLSRALETHYHRRCRVSLPGSRWDRVGPRLSGHQTTVPLGGFPPGKGRLLTASLCQRTPGGSLTTAQGIKVSAHSSRGGIGKNSICASLRIKKLSELSAGGPASRRRRTASRKILRSSQSGN